MYLETHHSYIFPLVLLVCSILMVTVPTCSLVRIARNHGEVGSGFEQWRRYHGAGAGAGDLCPDSLRVSSNNLPLEPGQLGGRGLAVEYFTGLGTEADTGGWRRSGCLQERVIVGHQCGHTTTCCQGLSTNRFVLIFFLDLFFTFQD